MNILIILFVIVFVYINNKLMKNIIEKGNLLIYGGKKIDISSKSKPKNIIGLLREIYLCK